MCGIVGLMYHDAQKACEKNAIVKMRDVMTYRGPDDAGLYLDGNLGLGHRRLSIIGLTTGHQPLSNEDDTLWIVFNGEIYNYRELKEGLIKKGHVFRTESDTEVILHLYEEEKEKCVNSLNGMFAFAIWNTRNRSLFIARDRMGIKPLYYANNKDVFAFSSEIKSLLECDQIPKSCNDESVLEYFLFKNVAGENTLYKGVNALLPGHTMTIDADGKLSINQYWEPYQQEVLQNIGYDEAMEEMERLLVDSVRIRMISEVPLGTFCSGGVDSSLVTAIAAQQVDHPVNTFSVGFYESGYDETHFARIVSDKYHTHHHEVKLSEKEYMDLLPKMIWHNDEPLNFSNSVHIYAISKLAKQHVTVVLTGEGADELFMGYPRYQIPKLLSHIRRYGAIGRFLINLATGITKDHRFQKLEKFAKSNHYDTLIFNSTGADPDEFEKMYLGSNKGYGTYRMDRLKQAEYTKNLLDNVSLLDQHTYLVSILYRQDKMSMAASVEARVPFLDYRLVEFANKLPEKYKLRGLSTKKMVKDLSKKYLPHSIINRKKSGFGVPVVEWMRGNTLMSEICDSLPNDNRITEYFDSADIKNMVEKHKKGEEDNSEFLWPALNFVLWREKFKI